MQKPEQQRKVAYFAVDPIVYQKVVNTLAAMPYSQVANVISEFAAKSRAMFDPLPPLPKFNGAGGQVTSDPPEDATAMDVDGGQKHDEGAES